MAFFTAIIPTYNRRDLLRRATESVFAQPGEPPQVIVVDDGSSDGTLEMLDAYGGGVEVLRQANRGPGAARNLGLSRATGEYVAFLDSDDLFFPWTLATYRRVIEEHGRPAFVAGKPLRFTDDAELAGVATPAGSGETGSGAVGPAPLAVAAFADYFASGDEWRWYGVSSFVIRRDALVAAGGFTDDAVNGEDADLAMKLGVARGFVQVTSPATFAYRDHAGNVTRDAEKSYRGLQFLIGQEREGRYPGGDARRAERLRILGRPARAGSLSLLEAGNVRAAWDVYRRTVGWSLRERRLGYVLGLPLMAARRLLTRRAGGSHRNGKIA